MVLIKINQMIIITGASRGIGKYLFERFYDTEERIIGTYNSTKINDKNKELYKVDISNFNAVSNWIKMIENKLTRIILINCAGKIIILLPIKRISKNGKALSKQI